jgi:hypothetical protein
VLIVSSRVWMPGPAEAARPVASYRTDLVTVALSAWFTGGLCLDVWAHNHVPKLETIFTPWHAVFYSGFVATAAWVLWLVYGHLRTGRRGLAAVPVGYGAAVLGLPLFALSGIGDLTWHTVFGIEQNVKILFSPTHLSLLVSMMFIVTAPLRAAWASRDLPAAPTLRQLLPAVLSLGFTAALGLMYLQYADVLVVPAETVISGLSGGQTLASGILAAFVVTNLILVAPPLVLARRWRLPVGAVTVGFLPLLGAAASVRGIHNAGLLASVLAAGVCADLLAAWLRPGPGRRYAGWTFGASAALVLWVLYVATATVVSRTVPTVVELWSGMPVVQTIAALGLAAVINPGPAPEPVSRQP